MNSEPNNTRTWIDEESSGWEEAGEEEAQASGLPRSREEVQAEAEGVEAED